MPPKILLSAKRFREPYLDAVAACGAEPTAIYLPEYEKPLDTLLDFDALLLCGGNDVDPARDGQEMCGARDVDAPRDEGEWYLLEQYLAQGKPVFGVCRGHQVLNVYFGGTLIQDLPNKTDHSAGTDFSRVHTVTAEAGSIVAQLYGTDSIAVNSYHHQAVDVPGKGLRITARGEDGVVEAMYLPEHLFLWALQWHPERLCDIDADACGIFHCFVEACQ